MTQTSMFDGSKEFKSTKPIRLIELFGGIGCQAKALENLNIEFEHYRLCDFDKYAVQSYNAIHGTNFMPSDITQIKAEDLAIVETDKYDYIMTYSFPCQSLSLAGKQEGMSRESGTRSGLLWEVERLLNECHELPQILLMENVPQVHGKKNLDNFNEWCEFLESKGYKNYYSDLNAKNYGIPQNRNRTFMISLLGDYYYNFPKPFELELRLKDILEYEVDEKYYLSDKALNGLYNTKFECSKLENRTETNNISPTLDTRCDCLGVVVDSKNKRLQKLAQKVNIGNDGQFLDVYNQIINEKISGTITTRVDASNCTAITQNYRIRKLTPLETWRLMGLSDTDFNKAKATGMSSAQLYKQAGNGIVVNVLMEIFRKLLGEYKK